MGLRLVLWALNGDSEECYGFVMWDVGVDLGGVEGCVGMLLCPELDIASIFDLGVIMGVTGVIGLGIRRLGLVRCCWGVFWDRGKGG